jgi:hypothetical protein
LSIHLSTQIDNFADNFSAASVSFGKICRLSGKY